jgi:hypothetical protein
MIASHYGLLALQEIDRPTLANIFEERSQRCADFDEKSFYLRQKTPVQSTGIIGAVMKYLDGKSSTTSLKPGVVP